MDGRQCCNLTRTHDALALQPLNVERAFEHVMAPGAYAVRIAVLSHPRDGLGGTAGVSDLNWQQQRISRSWTNGPHARSLRKSRSIVMLISIAKDDMGETPSMIAYASGRHGFSALPLSLTTFH